MFCPKCGKANDDSARSCRFCGAELPVLAPAGRSVDPAESVEAFVGAKNRDYYVALFDRFERGGSRFVWHWPAFFFTFCWLLYRKMWLNAAIYLVLSSFLMNPMMTGVALAGGLRNVANQLPLTLAWLVISFAIVPMIAPYLYYRHYKAKLRKLEVSESDAVRRIIRLQERGGISKGALAAGFTLVTGPYLVFFILSVAFVYALFGR